MKNSLSRIEKTRKDFREYLNKIDKDKNYKNGKYGQRKRLYGDYLYFQDRIKFEVNYQEWLKNNQR